MSNRIVPHVYRAIIDDVMSNIKGEFEEFGVDEDVLAQLQNKWETKVVASNVAQFEPQAPTSPPSRHPPIHPTHPHPPPPPQHHMHPVPPHAHPPHAQHPSLLQYPYPYPPPHGYPYPYQPPPHQGYQLPPLAAPPMPQPQPAPQAQQPPPPAPSPRVKTEDDDAQPKHGTYAPANGGGITLSRVPQVDGPAGDELDGVVGAVLPRSRVEAEDGWDELVGSASTPVGRLRSIKPSPLEAHMRTLAIPAHVQRRMAQVDGSSEIDPASPQLHIIDDGRGTEEIGSDLDDSDDSDADDVENDGAGGEAGDYVFCTYDKVQRVKNKWKCVLKDGMIHVNGRDYLFAKCNGEFEW
ncbi:transcription factor IIA, 1-like [Ceratobasidium sp. AG-Ba]|nr:transcription factor IIA, 1-like [Ceratobasidium sp. AG-Ba]